MAEEDLRDGGLGLPQGGAGRRGRLVAAIHNQQIHGLLQPVTHVEMAFHIA